ncbi:MAG: AAA family ATPase [Sporichthyaceae bacterium]
MRPHRLQVTAFGAFAGAVTIDFDDLAASGLFLLRGETGAGKSTLLDALGFALYGRVPGERGTARRLRSDHAEPATRTEIALEATLGGRRMRVTRSPEQERPKVRGTGTTSEPAKVLLEQFEGGRWTTISTRAGEADAEIADRLGMSADQFFQVILLPQGEFARFLRAGSDERAALLERLFGTDRFRDVETWLAHRRRDSTVELTKRQDEVGVLARLIAQIAEVEPPLEAAPPTWASDLAEQHAAAVATGARAVGRAQAALAAADASAEATRALAHRQRRRVEAEKRMACCTAAEGSLSALRSELEWARAAARVSAYLGARSGAVTDLTARLGHIETGVTDLRAERAGLILRRADYRVAAEALPRAERITAAVEQVSAALAAWCAAAASDQTWRERHVEAREGAATLAEEFLRIRRERLDSMVAELADTLHKGEPCPVCGSAEHPAPAAGRPGRITADDEDAAGAAAEAGRAGAERVGEQAASAAAEAAGAGRRLREGGELLADLAERADPTAVSEDLVAIAAACSDAEAPPAPRVTEAVRAALHRAVAERTELARLASQLPAVEARLTSVDAELAELAVAGTGAREQLAGAQQAAQAAGFGALQAAAAAARTDSWCEAATEKLAAHRREVDGLTALLADPDLDVALMPAADVDAAEAAVAAARAVHAQAIALAASARERSVALDRRVPEYLRALAGLEPVAAEAERVRALADLVNGQGANTRRMTLSAFVLAARLEEVAGVAGARLNRMTGGRYTLVHTDNGRDGRRKAGLGLLVRDSWTGTDRDTATLSGGETFMASLALALALADVVCAEAGGTRLDSLFVDEGFGSLDPDSLDEVMDVLDGLREGGRVVGIVSHVAELRARVPAQVHVRKHRHGSDLTVVS